MDAVTREIIRVAKCGTREEVGVIEEEAGMAIEVLIDAMCCEATARGHNELADQLGTALTERRG